MPKLHAPVNIDRLAPAGPPRTTGAGRFAIPVALMDGQNQICVLELVYDGDGADRLHRSLDGHLAAQGAGTPAPCPARSRADLLDDGPQ